MLQNKNPYANLEYIFFVMNTSSSNTPVVPRKIVHYRIANDPKAGALYLYGNPDSSHIAIFCAGYPDDHEHGQTFCFRLANENDMHIGLMCLPGYDDRKDKPWEKHSSEGFTFNEMVTSMREAVKVLRSESTYSNVKLTGIFHDWGVYVGSTWTNMTMEESSEMAPNDLILFDVLPPTHKNHDNVPNKSSPLSIYQVVLALSFAIRMKMSIVLARLIFILGLKFLKTFRLSPSLSIDSKTLMNRTRPMSIDKMIFMAYPYYNFCKAKIIGSNDEFLHFTLPKNLNDTPVLYLYGTEKRFMFHDESVVQYLKREIREKRSKSNAIAVVGAGHWLYVQNPESCLKEISAFMEA